MDKTLSTLSKSYYLLKKLQAIRPVTLLKSDSNTDFSCKYCEIFKNTYFEEHLHTNTSEVTLGNDTLGRFSGQSLSRPSWLNNATKIPVAFKPER